jgi:DNA-binding beta-propeller fold protein YncE
VPLASHVATAFLGGDALARGRDFSVYDLCWAGDRLYVGNYRHGEILVFDGSLRLIRTMLGIASPHGLAVDSAGHLYVATYRDGHVLKIDPAGDEIAGWDDALVAGDHLSEPVSVAIDADGAVWIADYATYQVIRADAHGHHELTVSGGGAGRMLPHCVAVRGEAVYVANRQAHLIDSFARDGRPIGRIPLPGGADADPLAARFVAGGILVPDYNTGALRLVDADGRHLADIATLGEEPGQCLYVTNAAPGPDHDIFVCEQDGNRIQRLRLAL